jgi:D-alanyl-D-alanine carboxypeptidase
VLESLMENPANQKIYHHIGTKGGSTSFVLTKAIYAQLINMQTMEVAYFFNDLTADQNLQLQKWLNDFNIALTQSRAFQDNVAASFKPVASATKK